MADSTFQTGDERGEVPSKGTPGGEGGGGGYEWDMSAPISTEDLIRAGGLGTRDDMGSVVPVAIDSTDLEEAMMDSMDRLEPGSEGAIKVSHAGIGFHSGGEEDVAGPGPSEVGDGSTAATANGVFDSQNPNGAVASTMEVETVVLGPTEGSHISSKPGLSDYFVPAHDANPRFA